jgi:hypothetical protein
VWIFWVRLRGIDNSSSHYSPSSSATYTVYMGESNGSFSVTATTTEPSGASWTNAAGGGNNSIIIKNGTLYGTAATANNVVVNNSDSNSTHRMVWHSGNNLYSTAGIYCNPYTDSLYANFIELSRTSDHGLKVGSIRGTAVGSRTG